MSDTDMDTDSFGSVSRERLQAERAAADAATLRKARADIMAKIRESFCVDHKQWCEFYGDICAGWALRRLLPELAQLHDIQCQSRNGGDVWRPYSVGLTNDQLYWVAVHLGAKAAPTEPCASLRVRIPAHKGVHLDAPTETSLDAAEPRTSLRARIFAHKQ
jgi:hypothetical protein